MIISCSRSAAASIIALRLPTTQSLRRVTREPQRDRSSRQTFQPVLLYHCADPAHRSQIEREGLQGVRFESQVFGWPSLASAHKYRQAMNASGWADIWAFEDHGMSQPSPLMSGGDQARVLAGDVPRENLVLVYRAS